MIEMIGMVGFLITVGIPLRWWCRRMNKQWSKEFNLNSFKEFNKAWKEHIKKMMDNPEQ